MDIIYLNLAGFRGACNMLFTGFLTSSAHPTWSLRYSLTLCCHVADARIRRSLRSAAHAELIVPRSLTVTERSLLLAPTFGMGFQCGHFALLLILLLLCSSMAIWNMVLLLILHLMVYTHKPLLLNRLIEIAVDSGRGVVQFQRRISQRSGL